MRGKRTSCVLRSSGCSDLSLRRLSPALPYSLGILQGGDGSLTYLAGESLTMMGAAAVPHVLTVLKNGSPEQRAKAVEILGAMGAEAAAAVPSIVPLLADEDWNLKFAADVALSEIGPTEEGIAALVAALGGADDEAVRAAVGILARYGGAARPALPALRKLASGDGMASYDAKDAIAAIESNE